ncbi:hypothetical protein BXZ70DRAFT_119227 [Cristinia sonorae]|uniref:Uncharacterized protein n=1 Tax=Cristinia sonorae TaxID=1940300 RepID=A0A8K0UP24_9AGAR|nr:hypothetical protein BXZ70DRAFT_119227 [Cristinia sonorae]
MMMPVSMGLFVGLIAVLTAVPTVFGAPFSLYRSVDLMTCGTPVNSTASQCANVCEPITQAQLLCNSMPYCTCNTAPAAVIQACLQCHINEEYQDKWVGYLRLELPPRVETYASMCSNILPARSQSPLPDLVLPDPPAAAANETLVRREGDICVYGLPDVVMLPQVYMQSYRSPWFVLGIVSVSIVCVFSLLRRKPSAQAQTQS